MRSFKDHNPISVFVFYIFAIVPAMFCINPVLMCISLAGGVSFRLAKDGLGALKKMLPFFAFPLLGVPLSSYSTTILSRWRPFCSDLPWG